VDYGFWPGKTFTLKGDTFQFSFWSPPVAEGTVIVILSKKDSPYISYDSQMKDFRITLPPIQ
jgi:hypothetical protein